MKTVAPKTLSFALAMTLLVGCRSASYRQAEEIMPLGSRLTKVTMAVESTVQYKSPPAEARDDELVRLATAHDPTLLTPFVDYRIRAESRSGHGIVLLCAKDGRALFEDVGCTAKLDKHHWESGAPCEFTLNVDEACR
jgi:hypothetical protein